MLERTRLYLQKNFPQLPIAGLYSPPFRPLSSLEEEQIIDTINRSGAKFVFVALGCPKQEKWMASMKGRVQACMIGIGGALPVLVGMQKRAPRWMQKTGLEWFYRMVQEPGRLFKRYAVTNTLFLWLLLKAWVAKK
jgi:N-acetylglucosaminyldiphosphoundecaprenol N-acetyl-beta-D-mannosaminyltransferase